MPLRVGDEAPPIETKDTRGNVFRLRDFRDKKNVVLFFFPRAFTPVCTKEVCGFRDIYEELASKDAEVVGVSTDDLEKQGNFATKYGVPFPLLSDPEKTIAKAYGALGLLRGLLDMASRVTFVIDKRGIVRGVFKHELSAEKHVADVRKTLAELA